MNEIRLTLLVIKREESYTMELKEGQRSRECILQQISAECCSVIKVEELNWQLAEVKY